MAIADIWTSLPVQIELFVVKRQSACPEGPGPVMSLELGGEGLNVPLMAWACAKCQAWRGCSAV
jgi:hypothetical protein